MGNAGCDVYNPVADGNQNVACFMMISNCLPWPFMKKKQFENVVVVLGLLFFIIALLNTGVALFYFSDFLGYLFNERAKHSIILGV